MKIYILVFLFLLSFLFGTSVFAAKTVTLGQYKKMVDVINLNLDKISDSKMETINSLTGECDYFVWYKNITISPTCIIDWELPKLEFEETVSTMWSHIKDFDEKYDLESTSFFYDGANPVYFDNNSLDDFVGVSTWDNIAAKLLDYANIRIDIPKYYIAKEYMKDYSFYVSAKNLDNRSECRKTNFLKALYMLDGRTLYSQQSFNYNVELVKEKNYCVEWGGKPGYFLFYGWVCGASTQLFRSSLINPDLYVTKRYSHGQRYVYFYNKDIYGDDASVYERDKQFEIKNIGTKPVYFKVFKTGNNYYLVSVLPYKNENISFVLKKQIWVLRAIVGRIVFDKFNVKQYEQFWVSNYYSKNYERD